MKVGIIGFGKTGKAVASIFLQNNDFSLEWIIRKSNHLSHHSAGDFLGIDTNDRAEIFSIEELEYSTFLKENYVDFIVDFSVKESIMKYGEIASNMGIKIISGISHYTEEIIEFIHTIAKKTVIFWSPNITLGINYLMFSARFLKKIAPWVDIVIVEEHFKQKKEKSGTAQKIAHSLEINVDDVHSVRAGGIVGRHEIIFGFPYQTVRLIHESISREAFGNGALFAARNLANKDKGFYTFEDLLLPYFSQ